MPSAVFVYWFPEETTPMDGGGLRAKAWKVALAELGYDVTWVGILDAPFQDGSGASRLSAVKRSVFPLPFERRLPELPKADLVVFTVPGTFRSGLKQCQGGPVALDWVDLWSEAAASVPGDSWAGRWGSRRQCKTWRRREVEYFARATFNTCAGFLDADRLSSQPEAQAVWLPTPQPARRAERRERGSAPIRSIGFIGNLRYPPNEIDLRAFLDAYGGALAEAGLTCVVAGFGSERVLDWGHDVRVLGAVDDPAELYGQVDAAVVPVTTGSGIKSKAVEAMAFGLPVFGTQHVREGFSPEFAPYVHDLDQLFSVPGGVFKTVPRGLFESRLSQGAFTAGVGHLLGLPGPDAGAP